MKKGMVTSLIFLSTLTLGLTACGKSNKSNVDGEEVNGKTNQELTIAALEGGYGREMYSEVISAFEKANPGVKVNLTISKSLEDEITPNMKAGKFPDLVVLGQGRSAGLTESLIKDNALEDVTDVLEMTVPTEDVKVKDKLIDGIVGNLNTNPYGDDQTYLMPMYYAPTGLVYDQNLLSQNNWEVPTTFEKLFKLGDEAKKKDINLFTYPTAGYMDSYFFSILAGVGGTDFYNDVMTYKKDIWKTEKATEVLKYTEKLLTQYTDKATVGHANEQDFTKNQQSILDDKNMFMPNGTWIVGEMADAPRADGFTWGLMPLPSVEEGGKRYLTTSVESVWVPKEGKNTDLAKQFMAYLYSDEAAKIFLESNAIQPIKGIEEKIEGETKAFYEIYQQEDVEALVGGFASTKPVEGVNIKEILFDSANSIISGDKTLKQWQSELNEASEKLRAAKD
ncbi:carbohydrate ABC transporter substrate-binding protein [Enterococcus hirae]